MNSSCTKSPPTVHTLRPKLYCQNLSLFGKLFIDIKTLFFDCDNCKYKSNAFLPNLPHGCNHAPTVLFYILTDADSQRDHVLGFFSKVSNLLVATILQQQPTRPSPPAGKDLIR